MTTYPRVINAIAALSAYTSAGINAKVDGLLTHLNNLIGGIDDYEKLLGKVQSATIASDTITASNDYIIVDTEGGAASDNLSTIQGYAEGRVIYIRMANAARVVTLVHGTGSGNPTLAGDGSVILSSTKWKALIGTATGWSDLGIVPGSELIKARTVVGTVGSYSITVPQTFNHLRLIMKTRCDLAATEDNLIMRFNGDNSAANYYTEYGIASGTSVAAAQLLGATATGIFIPYGAAGANAPTGYAYAILDILDYRDLTRRAVDGRSGVFSAASSGNIKKGDTSSWWTNAAAAISSITILPQNASNIVSGSSYELWGFN